MVICAADNPNPYVYTEALFESLEVKVEANMMTLKFRTYLRDLWKERLSSLGVNLWNGRSIIRRDPIFCLSSVGSRWDLRPRLCTWHGNLEHMTRPKMYEYAYLPFLIFYTHHCLAAWLDLFSPSCLHIFHLSLSNVRGMAKESNLEIRSREYLPSPYRSTIWRFVLGGRPGFYQSFIYC